MISDDGKGGAGGGIGEQLRSLAGGRALQIAGAALVLSVVAVEALHHLRHHVSADFVVRVQHALVRAIRNEPPGRIVVQDQEADPVITGSTPEQ
ncbi:MAG: hypothetical protein AAF441_00710 [Pseudomonadota bacterium]